MDAFDPVLYTSLPCQTFTLGLPSLTVVLFFFFKLVSLVNDCVILLFFSI